MDANSNSNTSPSEEEDLADLAFMTSSHQGKQSLSDRNSTESLRRTNTSQSSDKLIISEPAEQVTEAKPVNIKKSDTTLTEDTPESLSSLNNYTSAVNGDNIISGNGTANNSSHNSSVNNLSSVQTTSNLSLHNAFLKSSPANPETTIAEGEVSKIIKTSQPSKSSSLSSNSHKKQQPSLSLNDNLKQIEEKDKAKEKELHRKESFQALSKVRTITKSNSKNSIAPSLSETAVTNEATNSNNNSNSNATTDFGISDLISSVEQSPGRNSSFFSSVWNTAANSLRTPKTSIDGDFRELAPSGDDINVNEPARLNAKKVRDRASSNNNNNNNNDDVNSPLEQANDSTKIISYRKSSRKISTSDASHLRTASSASNTESVNNDNKPITDTIINEDPNVTNNNTTGNNEQQNPNLDFIQVPSAESAKSTFNKKLYSEDHVYDTKYHYASDQRNEDFHVLFKSVLPTDRLIDDFSCALSREILLQGRIYISDNSICFNSNILGWVTNLIVSFGEINNFEKTSTAGLFPNGIAITTKTAKHNFATFLSRDSTYEFLNTIWLNYIQRNGDASENKIDPKEYDQHHQDVIEEGPATKDDKNSKNFGTNVFANEPYLDYRKNFGISRNNDLFLKSLAPKISRESSQSDILHSDDGGGNNATGNNTPSEQQSEMSFDEQVFSIDEDEDDNTDEGDGDEDDEYDDDDDDDGDGGDDAYSNSDAEGDNMSIVTENEDSKSNDSTVTKDVFTEHGDQNGILKTPRKRVSISFPTSHAETDFVFDPEANKETVLVQEQIIDGSLVQVFNMLFGKALSFQQKYITSLNGSEISEVPKFKLLSESDLGTEKILADHLESGKKQRFYEYTKALNYSVGPKSTIVKIMETIDTIDFDKGVNIILKSLTPNVPSGNAFTVQTRYLLAWGPNNKTKLKVSYWINWTGRSWIKGIIEKSTNSGQVEAAERLVKLMQAEIANYATNEYTDLDGTGVEDTINKGGKRSVKKKKASGLGSPAVFQQDLTGFAKNAANGTATTAVAAQNANSRDRSASMFEIGSINEEIEEIEKTLWDIIYNNWVLVLIFSLIGVMMYFQIKMFNLIKENNALQLRQLEFLKNSGARRSFFGDFASSSISAVHDKANNKASLKNDVENNLWNWFKTRTPSLKKRESTLASSSSITTAVDSSDSDNNNQAHKTHSENYLKQTQHNNNPNLEILKHELNNLFENLLVSQQSLQSASDYHNYNYNDNNNNNNDNDNDSNNSNANIDANDNDNTALDSDTIEAKKAKLMENFKRKLTSYLLHKKVTVNSDGNGDNDNHAGYSYNDDGINDLSKLNAKDLYLKAGNRAYNNNGANSENGEDENRIYYSNNDLMGIINELL